VKEHPLVFYPQPGDGSQPPTAPVPPVPTTPVGGPFADPAPGGPAPTSTLAILSLVFAFLAAPVGLVLAFFARKKIKETGEGGRGLTTAAIIVSVLSMVLTVVAFVAMAVFARAVVDSVEDSTVIGPTAPVQLPPVTEYGPAPLDGPGEVEGTPVPAPGRSSAPVAPDALPPVSKRVVVTMQDDAFEMAVAQMDFAKANPGTGGLEVSFTDAPVTVGKHVVKPESGNIISVTPVPAGGDLPKGGFCVLVMNEKADEPVMFDSAIGERGGFLGGDEPLDAGACAVQSQE
jgi:peptidyl-prolyl cis-trans isomerase B (cyclophilin B)